ncbi:hypothetical protein T06_8768 [Trichinella sp. T6]|nr:hypothetical protein T06_8768 [Trichinella sp. T6]
MPCLSISCSCFSTSARKASGIRLGGTLIGDPTIRCFGMFLHSWVDPDAGTVVLSLVWHICKPRRRGQNFHCLIHFPLRMIALGYL